MSEIQQRPYQDRAVERVFAAWSSGERRTLLVLPTGTGKTVVAGRIIGHQESHPGQTLFVAHRDTLIQQAARTFEAMGLVTAIEKAGAHARRDNALFGRPDVVVGSIPSLQGERLLSWPRDSFARVIVDECHHSLARSYRTLIDHFEPALFLGITATPDASDRANLGQVFPVKADEYRLLDAIRDGWLCGIDRRVCLTTVDLRQIRTTGGDYNLGDLADRIGPHIEELADETIKHIGNRQTAVFTPDVGSALAFAQVLRHQGVSAKYVAGSGGKFGMPQAERDRVLTEFNSSEFQVIVSCDLLFEGWDCPGVKAVVIARPTKKRYRYIQMLGRGLRRFDWDNPSEKCVLVDFDWQQDEAQRDLDLVVDLFNDSEADPDVMAVARRRFRERGPQADPVEVIAEAEEMVAVARKFLIPITGRKSSCRVLTSSPAQIGQMVGLRVNGKYDLDLYHKNPATARQLDYLKNLGVRDPAALGYSKFGATKMIDRLKRRREQGLATLGQVTRLTEAGVNAELIRVMSAAEASRAISEIEAAKLGVLHATAG